MTEQIKFDDCSKWVQWFLAHLIVEFEKNGTKFEIKHPMELSITFNGQECPAMKTLEYMQSIWDRVTEEEAIKLVDEKLDNVTANIRNILYEAKQEMRQKLRNAGYELPDDED